MYQPGPEAALYTERQINKKVFPRQRQLSVIQHTKPATYQARYCWGQVMIAAPELPLPSDWGWARKQPSEWEVCWTTLPKATKACRELLRCRCKKDCRNQCKCLKTALQCTAFCHCGGFCSENYSENIAVSSTFHLLKWILM